MPITWETIEGYFTDMDVDHMKQVSAGWPKLLDLHDEQSVLYYAPQVHASVDSGRMPIGEPRWSPEQVANFYEWWQSQDPNADAKRIS
ncbi:hypothetical protein [Mesorhizobium sp. LSJC264A00]|uniref:hypothetical protein n=1 Tax=unclassified Mesorhizobium TaxID=325217 RepID=UPI0003CDD715|nr:hypothetical protein [Mesorhizobium sp. LSJC264A00]ESX24160.1 hypothetical protein X767_13105 [Mesorhizobium sp. LSJC264A00]